MFRLLLSVLPVCKPIAPSACFLRICYRRSFFTPTTSSPFVFDPIHVMLHDPRRHHAIPAYLPYNTWFQHLMCTLSEWSLRARSEPAATSQLSVDPGCFRSVGDLPMEARQSGWNNIARMIGLSIQTIRAVLILLKRVSFHRTGVSRVHQPEAKNDFERGPPKAKEYSQRKAVKFPPESSLGISDSKKSPVRNYRHH
ncbi:hypothetical protein BKA93DRAFT_612165 [Sparassis latifolia]